LNKICLIQNKKDIKIIKYIKNRILFQTDFYKFQIQIFFF
jgi:hypothetical protein